MPQEEAETFQHYRVLRRDDGSLWKLGAGAMGVTYKAIDTNLDAPVALKVINALYTGNESARERFIREARAAASLRHRNVASIHHLGRDEQSFFYAMEFIDGETVEHFIKREGPQSWRIALPTALQVTRALMAAHEKHLVHRDIKPANVMLVREVGEDDFVVKLIDFGLAKSLAEKNGSVINVSGSGFLGTPLYASPEQCEEHAPDIRSDIYSLGVTLWFVLAGRPPFIGPSTFAVFSQHLHAPPRWDLLPAAVPEPVRALLAQILAKDRADRPQTPTDLRRELEKCLRACGEGVPAASFPAAVAKTFIPFGSDTPKVASALLVRILEPFSEMLRSLLRSYLPAPTPDSFVAETISDATPDAGPVTEEFLEVAPATSALPTSLETPAVDISPTKFSLEDTLRHNGGLFPPALVADLLVPLAQIVDNAGITALDLTPHGVWIVRADSGTVAPHGIAFAHALLTGSESGWLEVLPPEVADASIPTDSATVPPARAGFATSVEALAALAYELLHGTPPAPDVAYRSLAECDEEANALLRQALSGGFAADSATAFAEALEVRLRLRAGPDFSPPPACERGATPNPRSRVDSLRLFACRGGRRTVSLF